MVESMLDLWRCRATSGERIFIERIKAQIFLETILAVDFQYNLEKKASPSVLKDNLSSITDLSIFTSIGPMLLDQSNKAS